MTDNYTISIISFMNHLTTITCPNCDSKKYSVLYKSTLKKKDFDIAVLKKHLRNSLDDFSKHSQIVKCNRCGLVYANPREDLKKLLKAYTGVVDKEYLTTEKFRKILSSRHLQKILNVKKKGRLLDVGCFCGFFLELARGCNFNAFGVEPSMWAREVATHRGSKIIGKTIYDVTDKKFDIITLWDVIEHLDDPKKDLKKIYNLLNADGIIAIGTPNIKSMTVKILGGKHPFFTRMHLALFDPITLKEILQQTGFEIIHTSYYGRTYPLYYYLERLTTLTSIAYPILRVIKKYKRMSEIPITVNLRDEMVIIAQKR